MVYYRKMVWNGYASAHPTAGLGQKCCRGFDNLYCSSDSELFLPCSFLFHFFLFLTSENWCGYQDVLPVDKCMCAKLLQSCLTLCDPMDCSSGSSAHGILQARILEWGAMPTSRQSSGPKDRTRVSYVSCFGRWVLYHSRHLGSPLSTSADPLFPTSN